MDKKRNADIYWEFNVVPLLFGFSLENYRHNWTTHLHCTNRYRIPGQMKNHRPNGKSSLDRSNKRWSETVMNL